MALGVDHDLAEACQLHRALEPVGVGQQADLHEDAFQRHGLDLFRRAVLVGQAGDLLAVAVDLGGLGVEDDGHIGQALELLLQHGIGLELAGELQQRHAAHDAGQVDGRFHARVAAADDGHILALEQRSVAVRAVGHALGAVLVLARHVHVAPARAGREDDGLGLEAGARGGLHLDQPAFRGSRNQFGRRLQVHDVHLVVAHMALHGGGQLRAFGLGDRDEVLDVHGVQHLAAEALGGNAGADALACRIDGSGRAGGAATDDQHVEGVLGGNPGRFTRSGAGVDLGDDLGQLHAALAEALAIDEDRGHAHDFALLDFLLEQPAVDGGVADLGIEHGHQVQRLHHVRAVVAGQRVVGLEVQRHVDIAHLLQQLGRFLGRMAADLQQGQHQRGEFMAQGDACETHAAVHAGIGDQERGLAHLGVVVLDDGDLVAQLADFQQQFLQLARTLAVIQRSHQLHRTLQALQVGLQLGFQVVVKHVGLLGKYEFSEKKARAPGTRASSTVQL